MRLIHICTLKSNHTKQKEKKTHNLTLDKFITFWGLIETVNVFYRPYAFPEPNLV